MSKIGHDSAVSEIAALVSQALERAGITAVLSGGAAVTIYSENRYSSLDLDFVTSASLKAVEQAIGGLGFQRTSGRYFTHPQTPFFLEFPAGPLAVGDEICRDWARLETGHGILQILSPTQCVMDRLAAFYHWHDPQALEQAVLVGHSQPIDLRAIEAWSVGEGFDEQFAVFKAWLVG